MDPKIQNIFGQIGDVKREFTQQVDEAVNEAMGDYPDTEALVQKAKETRGVADSVFEKRSPKNQPGNPKKPTFKQYRKRSILTGLISMIALPLTLGLSIFGLIPTGIFAYKAYQINRKAD